MSLKVRVTSASKKAQKLAEAPAAIFVITAEDIRRGGFSCLPEALRLVPGLYVAKVSAHWWTISARGFSDYLNNKMLVLIDGRSVYTRLFGGVFWELQDIPLDDVDRIEVIRGPGGTLWGSNSVNGVINIITKPADATQGASGTVFAGSGEGYGANVQYGGRIGERTAFRISGRATYLEPGVSASGGDAYDFSNLSQGAIRMDSRISRRDDLSFQSGMYEGRQQTELPTLTTAGASPARVRRALVVRGGYLLTRWNRSFSERSNGNLLAYCDWIDRTSGANEARTTCRLEFQHDVRLRMRHSVIWGATLETSADSLYESFAFRGVPAHQRTGSASVFAQYEFEIIPDRLRVITGSKFEHNSYTGFEVQPQIRAVWTPSQSHVVWAAVSRAVRLPARFQNSEEYVFTAVPGAVPTFLTAAANPGLAAETLRAYELGYRFSPVRILSVDTALFYNHYEGLINLNLVNPLSVSGPPRIHTNPSYVEIPVPWQNLGPGQTHGLELYANFQPVDRWLLAAGVTELRGNCVNMNDALNLSMANSTRHQFNVHSRWNVTSRVDFDVSLYHYNGIAGFRFGGVTFQDVPTHNRVDAGVSLRIGNNWLASLWGRDLGAGPHWENRTPLFTTGGSETRGQVIGLGLTWRSNPGRAPRISSARASAQSVT